MEDFQPIFKIINVAKGSSYFCKWPQSFKEVACDYKWTEAINEELKMIVKNDTWEFV